MNEWLKKLVSSLKELWTKWTLVQKVILFGIIAVVIVALILMLRFSSQPTTVPLFNQVIKDEVALDNILFRLDQENVDYDVNSAGIISVENEATARRMRAVLVREDLVPVGIDPWVVFDTERWTLTDMERNVNLQRAITQVVTQHIEALDDVDNANVVLSIPEKATFASEQEPTKASVIIYSKPGSDITKNKKKILGIQKLLQLAVEGLTPENITIADASGNIINDFEGMEASERVDIIAKEQKLIAQLEMEYRARILSSLKDIYKDRIQDLNIKIDMDMSKRKVSGVEYKPIERKADNPNTPYDDSDYVDSIAISSETVTRVWTGTGYNPEGPAGVEGQNPPVYSDMSNLYGTSEETGVKQNNVINTEEYQEEISPGINSISVSVNIDGVWTKDYDEKGQLIVEPNGAIKRTYHEVSQADLDRAKRLIEGAIRLHGDSKKTYVTVESIQVDRTAQFEEENMKYLRERNRNRTILISIACIAVVLLAFMIIRLISREVERRRRKRQEELLLQSQLERQRTIMEAEQAGMEVTMSVEERHRAELQENAIMMAKEHPEDVAMLIRTWLMEE